MVPTVQAFMAAHRLPDVTVVADAGMVSAGNQKAIEDAGLSFILGARIPDVPYVVKAVAARTTPAPRSPTGTSSPSPGPPAPPTSAVTRSSTTSTGPTGPAARCAGSTSRSPRPRRPSPARRPVKRNRFVQLTGGTRTVNRDAGGQGPRPGRAEGLRHQPAGLPGRHPGHRRVRDRRLPPAVPDREELPDVQARPAGPADLPPQARLDRSPPDHRVRRPRRQPLDRGHAPAGRSRSSSSTARRYRTIEIQAGAHTITAADPLPDDLRRRPRTNPPLKHYALALSQVGCTCSSQFGVTQGQPRDHRAGEVSVTGAA